MGSLDSKALLSLAEAKEYLAVTTSTQDAILNSLINEVSFAVARYCKRDLVSQDYTEYYSGDGTRILQLKNFPIVTLTTVWLDSLRQFADGARIYYSSLTSNLIVKKNSALLEAFNLFGAFASGQSNIKVTYTAGYTIGTGSGSGTMPYDIRLAIKRLLDKNWRQGFTHRKLDVISENLSNNENITYKDEDFPKDVKTLLSPHVKRFNAPQYEYAD